jgi:hypothetical protein
MTVGLRFVAPDFHNRKPVRTFDLLQNLHGSIARLAGQRRMREKPRFPGL